MQRSDDTSPANEFPSRLREIKLDILLKNNGTDPGNWLYEISTALKLDMSPILGGIEPVSEFPDSFNTTKLLSNEIVPGMGPPMRLLDKSRDVSVVIELMLLGNVPINDFPLKSMAETRPPSHVIPVHVVLHRPTALT